MCLALFLADVDGDYVAIVYHITDGRHEQGGSAHIRPALNDDVRSLVVDDLLVNPGIERALGYSHTKPVTPSGFVVEAVSIQHVELVNWAIHWETLSPVSGDMSLGPAQSGA